MWIAAAALPLVTLPAALAAGAAHLRRWTGGEEAGLRFFVADLRAALRGGGWAVGFGYGAALALVAVDLVFVRALPVPGGRAVGALAILAALWLTVTLLRAATAWRTELRWRDLLGPAARRALRDPAGSLLVVCGLAVIAASAWFSPPLALPALGILVASTLAAEHRARPRHRPDPRPRPPPPDRSPGPGLRPGPGPDGPGPFLSPPTSGTARFRSLSPPAPPAGQPSPGTPTAAPPAPA